MIRIMTDDQPYVPSTSQQPGYYMLDGEERYWTGNTWITVPSEPRDSALPGQGKLNVIGGIAIALLVIGVCLALLGGFNDSLAGQVWGGSFIGSAFTIWVLWLAVGAIVEAIRGKK